MSYSPVILNSKTIDRAGIVFCVEGVSRNKFSVGDIGCCFQNAAPRGFRSIVMEAEKIACAIATILEFQRPLLWFSNGAPVSRDRQLSHRSCRSRRPSENRNMYPWKMAALILAHVTLLTILVCWFG
jgi:hypothetical protein